MTEVNQQLALHVERPIALTTLDEVVRFAEIAYKAAIFPDVKNANQAVVKIMLGRELGFGALASLRGVMIDKRGQITLAANLQAAAVQRAGYSWRVIRLDEMACELEFIDPQGKTVGISALTIQQAKAANMHQQWDDSINDGKGGWKEKVTWRNFPRNMLFARCISNGVKWFVPFVTNGVAVYDPDELTPNGVDIVESTATVVDKDGQKAEGSKAEPVKAEAPSTNGNGKAEQAKPFALSAALDLITHYSEMQEADLIASPDARQKAINVYAAANKHADAVPFTVERPLKGKKPADLSTREIVNAAKKLLSDIIEAEKDPLPF